MNFVLLTLALLAATPLAAQNVTIIGDSILAWNRETGESVGDTLSARLGRPVEDLSTGGALFRGGFWAFGDDIRGQFKESETAPDVVVFNGGGNDLAPFCHDEESYAVMDRLVAPDLTGAIPAFVDELNAAGITALFLGYYDMPDEDVEFAPCVPMFETMGDRLLTLADQTPGFYFVSGASVIDPSDLGNFDEDKVHPSPRASELLGVLLADQIAALP